MGRGLSQLQKNMLGIAYNINRQTQDVPGVKCEDYRIGYETRRDAMKMHGVVVIPAESEYREYKTPHAEFTGVSDFQPAVAIAQLYNIPFNLPGSEIDVTRVSKGNAYDGTEQTQRYTIRTEDTVFPSSPAQKSARAAVIRATARLKDRGLLAYSFSNSNHREILRWGFILSREGFEIGAEHEIEVPPPVIWRCGVLRYAGSHEIAGMLERGEVTLRQVAEAQIILAALRDVGVVGRYYGLDRLLKYWDFDKHELTDTDPKHVKSDEQRAKKEAEAEQEKKEETKRYTEMDVFNHNFSIICLLRDAPGTLRSIAANVSERDVIETANNLRPDDLARGPKIDLPDIRAAALELVAAIDAQ